MLKTVQTHIAQRKFVSNHQCCTKSAKYSVAILDTTYMWSRQWPLIYSILLLEKFHLCKFEEIRLNCTWNVSNKGFPKKVYVKSVKKQIIISQCRYLQVKILIILKNTKFFWSHILRSLRSKHKSWIKMIKTDSIQKKNTCTWTYTALKVISTMCLIYKIVVSCIQVKRSKDVSKSFHRFNHWFRERHLWDILLKVTTQNHKFPYREYIRHTLQD